MHGCFGAKTRFMNDGVYDQMKIAVMPASKRAAIREVATERIGVLAIIALLLMFIAVTSVLLAINGKIPSWASLVITFSSFVATYLCGFGTTCANEILSKYK